MSVLIAQYQSHCGCYNRRHSISAIGDYNKQGCDFILIFTPKPFMERISKGGNQSYRDTKTDFSLWDFKTG